MGRRLQPGGLEPGSGNSPVPLTIARTALSITPGALGVYSFVATVTAATEQDIPLKIFNQTCGIAMDTEPGDTNTVDISGTATFTSLAPGGPVNRLDIVTTGVSGLTDDDVSLTGGFDCATLSVGLEFFVDLLGSAVVGEIQLCGAPGPTLFVECPASNPSGRPVASSRRRL